MIKAKTLFKAVCLSSLVFALNAQAQTNAKGCAAKKASLERQISYAKKHGNTYRIAGLETALSEVNANCTDAGLRANREDKIKEKQAKVAERQADLKEAQAAGDSKKIAKKQKKVQEAQVELKEAQNELNQ
jgi:hypothetical protein